MNPKILFVDDEPNLLQSVRRGLRGSYDLHFAEGGLAGLRQLRTEGPFAVVVSDMQMPQFSGLQVLAEAKKLSPDTVRIMLTGDDDPKTATNAVNDGEVFRLLKKPCPLEEINRAIQLGIRHYDQVTTERAILSKTLMGSVGLITEILSLVNPTAFGRAGRLRQLAKRLCEKLAVEDAWQVELAAMLSQIGYVAVPEPIIKKMSQQVPLSPEEELVVESHAKVGGQLVGKIPKLESVAEMIAKQSEAQSISSFPGIGPHNDRSAKVDFGAFVLRMLVEFDRNSESRSMLDAILAMKEVVPQRHPPELLTALSEMTVGKLDMQSVTVKELRERMVLDENVTTNHGEILISKGHEVTSSLIQRLRSFEQTAAGVKQPIRVLWHSN